MTTNEQRREALMRLANALVEDMLATPDNELVADFVEADGDPAKNAQDMRALFERSVLKTNKERLRAAQSGLEADRAAPRTAKIVNIHNARTRLRRALAACPPNVKVTLAARNESELSDADILGMLQDLEELGVVIPDQGEG